MAKSLTMGKEAIDKLMENTAAGMLSVIDYDKGDGDETGRRRLVEPKKLVEGTATVLIKCFQLMPVEGLRNFCSTKIVSVVIDTRPIPRPNQNHFCTGEIVKWAPDEGDPSGPPNIAADALKMYTGALRVAVTDLKISTSEKRKLATLAAQLMLGREQLRAAHAIIFAEYMLSAAADGRIDEGEMKHIVDLNYCLASIGWRPS